jgi:hypothetical protein
MKTLKNTVPDDLVIQKHRFRRYSRAYSPPDASVKPLYHRGKRTKTELIFVVKSKESTC